MLKSKSSLSSRFKWSTIWLTFFISYGLMCLIFPEIYLLFQYSWIRFSDTVFNYHSAFAVTSSLYHGGVPLWDSYDQMPISFAHLVAGFYTLNNYCIAVVYYIFERCFDSQSYAFHVIYSLVYYGLNMFLRTLGGYLLASRCSNSKWVCMTSVVLFNIFLLVHFHLGYGMNALYSFFPLLVYLLIKYFDEFKFRDFLYFILVMTLAIATNPLHALNYFYLGLHFVILSCIARCLVIHRVKIVSLCVNYKQTVLAIKDALVKDKLSWYRLGQVSAVCVLIMLPSLYMAKTNYHDYYFDIANSRMNNIWSFSEYFKRSLYFAPKEEFLWRLVDFNRSDWAFSWVWVGYSMVFLILLGCVFSRDNRKYVFIGSVWLYWAINSPRISHTIFDAAHLLNALTNPFKFLQNSFHMMGPCMMGFVLFPLVVLGLQSLSEILHRVRIKALYLRLVVFLGLLLTFVIIAGTQTDGVIHAYVIKSCIVSILLIVICVVREIPQKISVVVVAALGVYLFCQDAVALRKYMWHTFEHVKVTAHQLKGINTEDYVHLAYHNPVIHPFRRHYLFNNVSQIKHFLKDDAIGMTGLFYQYNNFFKLLVEADNYHPVHNSYSHWGTGVERYRSYSYEAWPGNKAIYQTLMNDKRMVYFVRDAVQDRDGRLADLVNRKLTRSIVSVDSEASDVLDQIPSTVQPIRPEEIVYKTHLYKISDGQQREWMHLMAVRFRLPDDCPPYVSSTIFTEDQKYLKVSLALNDQSQVLKPVQGHLIRPFTFDVNNIHDGFITIMIPEVMANYRKLIVKFDYATSITNGISRVERNTWDEMAFTYDAQDDGWLVVHQPFDPRFVIKVDGVAQDFYKANTSFTAFRISRGMHDITIAYWPNTPLRWLILVSVLVSAATLFGVVRSLVAGERAREVVKCDA